MSLVEIDGHPIGERKPGPVSQRVLRKDGRAVAAALAEGPVEIMDA